ncbi:crotonase/enoyl-CoA hydratase family protein [Frankia sp. AgKG'84/4]|uniref:crotonase/enoyl-CoA hydratase family protein n=1 Tax=Frankia sp. AgKG'84/4 TaxID=573490 RepID=UPI00200CFDC4|nr:crotonase/enoyl-CoA hydratase family protein [Frankia sp. AgKG'84/4]MCL9795728.1 crotonase/enoyl-CoA hydratase family protein [Frankia sp. AgKG'84/4]
MTPLVLVDIRDGVAEVRLNRPEKINALDQAMFVALAEAGERLRGQPAVRVVVLSGQGRGFCAGLDVAMFAALAAGGSGALAEVLATDGGITHRGQQAAWVWTELEVPVIAAIHGPCLGGGLQIALGADIRIVAPDASLGLLEVRWGIIPDLTASLTLPQLVGPDVARELYWTGRTVDGTEAVRLGLATRVAPDPRAAALALATEIAARSPDAVRAGKRLLAGPAAGSPAEQLARERAEITALFGGANQVEAVEAFFEKRPPVYRDPP